MRLSSCNTDKFQFDGVYYGKEIIRNEFGRTVAVISYYFGKTSIMLEKTGIWRKKSS